MPKFEQPTGTSLTSMVRRRRRAKMFHAANGRCFYCGGPVFEEGCEQPRDWLMVRAAPMALEHRIPTVRGGGNEPENIVCGCGPCNRLKGAFTADEFRVLLAFRSGDLDFRFPGEAKSATRRDWLICHSGEPQERDLVTHNMPSARQGYEMRLRHDRRRSARA